MLKNFVAAAVFSVSYFLNVVEEFRSCLSKPEGSVCHFGLSIGRAVMMSHSRCAKDSASCDTKFCLLREHRTSGVGGRVVEEFRSCCCFLGKLFLNDVEEFRSCLSKPEGSVCHFWTLYVNQDVVCFSLFAIFEPLSQLTHCGLKTNKPSSVAWRPLSQLTHCGLKTNKPSSVPWRPLSQLTRCGRKRNEPSSNVTK